MLMGGTRFTNNNHSDSPSPTNPGTTGLNDASDPNNLDIATGTPGSTGLNDRAFRTNNGSNFLDAAFFPGCSAWYESSINDADDISVEAAEMRLRIPESNRSRLDTIINNVDVLRTEIEREISRFERTRQSRYTPAILRAKLEELNDNINVLSSVLESWDAVLQAHLIEFLERVGRSQVNQARRLQAEIQELNELFRNLAARASGDEINQVAAQIALNAAIGVGSTILAAMFGPLGLAVLALGGVAQLTVDELLGPDDAGLVDLTATTATVTSQGSRLAEVANNLSSAGRNGAKLLGAAGTVVGLADDGAELIEAAQRAADARVELNRVARRLRSLDRRINRFLPILAYPKLVKDLLVGMRREAAILRRHGQLALNRSN